MDSNAVAALFDLPLTAPAPTAAPALAAASSVSASASAPAPPSLPLAPSPERPANSSNNKAAAAAADNKPAEVVRAPKVIHTPEPRIPGDIAPLADARNRTLWFLSLYLLDLCCIRIIHV